MANPEQKIGTTRYNLDEQIKDIMIDTMREVFSRHTDYKYVPGPHGGPDLDETGIVITDTYSYETKYLPAIVLAMSGGRDYAISFNQNLGKILENPDGEKYHQFVGGWDTTVNCIIGTEDTITREELTSFVAQTFMHWKRTELIDEGLFVKNVSIGGETEEPYVNDYIYFSNVSIEIYSEWEARLPVDQTITNLNFDMRLVNNLV